MDHIQGAKRLWALFMNFAVTRVNSSAPKAFAKRGRRMGKLFEPSLRSFGR
jgi:hypothetical protein